MVKYAEVLSTNSSFFSNKAAANLTAVFVGATNGIGLGTLRAFAKHTQGASPTIYLVGRSQKSLDTHIATVATLNSSAKVVPILAKDLTLIKDAQSAANEIAESADKIDLLVMSPGYLSTKRDESSEGLDRLTVIRYYTRMRFLLTLAPLLRKSKAPRVVSVLGAGMEGELWPEDWELRNHYSLPKAAGAASSMMILFLEEFSKQPGNENIGISYTYPGMVGGTALKFDGLFGFFQILADWVILPLFKLFGYTIDEAGERTLYGATSEKLSSKIQSSENAAIGSDGQKGSGVYLLHQDSSVLTSSKLLNGLRERGMGRQVWSHTLDVFGRVESS